MEDRIKEALEASCIGTESYSPLLGKIWWYGSLEALDAGQVLIEQGIPYDGTFFLVVEGKLNVEVSGVHNHSLKAGAICGETGMYGTEKKETPHSRTATVTVAEEGATVLRYDGLEDHLSQDETDELLKWVEPKVDRVAKDVLSTDETQATD